MTYATGDPAHIEIGHNDLITTIQEMADSMAITVTLPDTAGLGDSGHVADHNLIVAAIQTIADEATANATISATTGSPASSSITGYSLLKWTGNGSFTVSVAGLVTVLVAGGGGGGNSSRAGGAGGYVSRTLYLEPGTYTVTVGAGGTLTQFGGDSRMDNIVAFGGGNNTSTARVNWGGSAPGGGYSTNIPGQGNASTGTWGGGGAGGQNSGNTGGVGLAWIDGVTYCAGGSEPGAAGAANTGNGGGGGNYSGGSGVVIVAVAV